MLADRALVTMTTHFMRSYSLLAIKTCHRRDVHAMGGMAAQIPIKNDPEANEQALAKVRADKEREATDGHDGTWVAHPGLVPIALEAFDKHMPGPNQIDRKREDVHVTAADLLKFEPAGPITEAGLRTNVNVAIQYLGSWLGGIGCVPIYNLMEDAATAEISRARSGSGSTARWACSTTAARSISRWSTRSSPRSSRRSAPSVTTTRPATTPARPSCSPGSSSRRSSRTS